MQQSPLRNCKSVMRGFARRQEILSIYSGNTPMPKREKYVNRNSSSKGRNKISHSKSISSSVAEHNGKQANYESFEYDYTHFDPKTESEMKNKR